MSNEPETSESGIIAKFVAAVLIALITGLGGGAFYTKQMPQESTQLERRLTLLEERLEQQTKAVTRLEVVITDLRQSPIYSQQKKGR